jgi:endoglucanase
VVQVNWAGIQPTGVNVQARSRYVVEGGLTYLEVSFSRSAPTLALDAYVEVQQQFHTNPYEDFDESDDYSFDRRRTSFADSQKITVHQNETLVWGTPPR